MYETIKFLFISTLIVLLFTYPLIKNPSKTEQDKNFLFLIGFSLVILNVFTIVAGIVKG